VLRSWLAVLSLCACTGEQVTASTVDSGVVTDVAIADSGVSDVAGDTTGAMCAMPNLIPNGDFTSGDAGWTHNDCSVEPIASAPCGRGLRLYECMRYGDIHRRVVRAFSAKTRVRLRVYFRASGVGASRPPAALVRFFRAADGGEVVDEEIDVIGTRNADWTMSEATLTLERDHDGFDATVVSGLESATGPNDEFAVAGLTLETL
jgi:hypothetical protein